MTPTDPDEITILGTSHIEFLDDPENDPADLVVIDESSSAPVTEGHAAHDTKRTSFLNSTWLVPAATIFMLVFLLIGAVVVISSPLGEALLGSPEQDEIRAHYRANGIEVDINRLGWIAHDSGKRVKEYRVGLYEPAFRGGKRVRGQYLGEHYWYFDKYGDRVEVDTGEKTPLERSLEKLLDVDTTGR